jgi:membrane-bound metal-dependent hydrolase YbcI (DUF457 family)
MNCASTLQVFFYEQQRKENNLVAFTHSERYFQGQLSNDLYRETLLSAMRTQMPYTPIHCSIAYLSRAIKPQISLPSLIVSTLTPDLEIPFIYIFTGGQQSRLVLHSLLGAVTLATIISLVLTLYAYSPIVSYLFKIDYATVKGRCRFSRSIVAFCLIGNLSHVLIDSTHHEYNPMLFPFSLDSFNSLLLMNNWTQASVIIQLTFLSLLIFFTAKEVRKGTKGIWKRLLVE